MKDSLLWISEENIKNNNCLGYYRNVKQSTLYTSNYEVFIQKFITKYPKLFWELFKEKEKSSCKKIETDI